jgi:hypothetical protein
MVNLKSCNQMYKIGFTMFAVVMVLGIVSVSQARAYTAEQPSLTGGHYTAKVTINFKDTCWKEAYLRMANRDNNHILINKQYFYNTPSLGPSKTIYTELKFEAIKVTQTESGRFRAYVIIDDGFSKVDQFFQFDPKVHYYHINLFMNTNTAACT